MWPAIPVRQPKLAGDAPTQQGVLKDSRVLLDALSNAPTSGLVPTMKQTSPCAPRAVGRETLAKQTGPALIS